MLFYSFIDCMLYLIVNFIFSVCAFGPAGLVFIFLVIVLLTTFSKIQIFLQLNYKSKILLFTLKGKKTLSNELL